MIKLRAAMHAMRHHLPPINTYIQHGMNDE